MNVPFQEVMKSIPGVFGIRLEEELPYIKLEELGDIELRLYPEFTLAQVDGQGTFDEASSESFRTLAEFIFGKNREEEKLSMTTPVFMDQRSSGWTMSFYIPNGAHLTPINDSIRISQHPEKTVAVYHYSGNNDEKRMMEARTKLLSSLKENGFEPQSDVWWAQYDQPMALPFVKRNEALVKIDA